MLRQVKLTNFRRHRSATFNFGLGHNVLRGANEQGKSTIAEAFAYALFGSDALRDKLADCVTWGEKDSTLKVRVVVDMAGKAYTFTRGKSGAECVYDGGLVTGQTEVSKFAASMLGADYKLASKLMIASQKGLMGALSEGPKATGELIEGMADFDLFERLVNAMTEKLVLGAPVQFEQRLREAQERLDANPVPAEVDVSALEAAIAEKTAEGAAKRAWAQGEGKASASASKTALDLSEASEKSRLLAKSNLDAAEELLLKHRKQHAQRVQVAFTGPSLQEINSQRTRVAHAIDSAKRSAAYKAVTQLMAGYPEAYWDESVDSLQKEIAHAESRRDLSRTVASQAASDIRVAEANLVRGSVCGFCDQDTSKFPGVAAANAALEAQINTWKILRNANESLAEVFEKTRNEAQAVLKSAAPYQRAALTYAAFVEVDESNVPPRLTWIGEVPDGNANQEHEQKRLLAIEEQKRRAEEAAADVRALERSIAEDDATIKRLVGQLAAFAPPEDIEALRLKAKQAQDDYESAMFWARELELQADRLKGEIAHARAAREALVKQREAIKAEVEACRAQLDELGFNNTLLAKIRRARPIISDKLWNTVLHAVTTMFSGMRGEASLVTKDKDGFKVNGKPVTSLSGSTLDLLALAIRVAMIKTFLPHCPFLSLDEPFAACDEDRTTKMLGFITSTGFQQTLVITHEEASEAVSDNLVML